MSAPNWIHFNTCYFLCDYYKWYTKGNLSNQTKFNMNDYSLDAKEQDGKNYWSKFQHSNNQWLEKQKVINYNRKWTKASYWKEVVHGMTRSLSLFIGWLEVVH